MHYELQGSFVVLIIFIEKVEIYSVSNFKTLNNLHYPFAETLSEFSQKGLFNKQASVLILRALSYFAE